MLRVHEDTRPPQRFLDQTQWKKSTYHNNIIRVERANFLILFRALLTKVGKVHRLWRHTERRKLLSFSGLLCPKQEKSIDPYNAREAREKVPSFTWLHWPKREKSSRPWQYNCIMGREAREKCEKRVAVPHTQFDRQIGYSTPILPSWMNNSSEARPNVHTFSFSFSSSFNFSHYLYFC